MALDRQSIEKRDFQMARRGYNPEAVDAHLSAIADQVEELTRAGERGRGSLADTAGDQVRAILEAAQSTAAQIRADAEEEARRTRGEARDHVEATRASAAAEAGEHVSHVSRSTGEMLERIERIDQELSSLFDVLRDAAARINAQLGELHAELHGGADATPAPGPAREVAASAEEPAVGREPAEAAKEIEPERAEARPAEAPPAETKSAETKPAETKPADARPAEPRPAEPRPAEPRPAEPKPREPAPTAAAPSNSDQEGARLIALNMALNGSPRQEIDRYLTEHYDLADQGSLLDEVFASVRG